jgi:AraC-like DNA-binding protein
MVKRITTDDRRLIRKIKNRLNKKLTWREIAAEFDFNSASHAYNWFFDRVREQNGEYIPVA